VTPSQRINISMEIVSTTSGCNNEVKTQIMCTTTLTKVRMPAEIGKRPVVARSRKPSRLAVMMEKLRLQMMREVRSWRRKVVRMMGVFQRLSECTIDDDDDGDSCGSCRGLKIRQQKI